MSGTYRTVFVASAPSPPCLALGRFVRPLGVEPRSLGLKVRYSAIELEAQGHSL